MKNVMRFALRRWARLLALGLSVVGIAANFHGPSLVAAEPTKSLSNTPADNSLASIASLVGWASVAGGTSGGQRGSIITVRDSAGLEEAVRTETPMVVQVAGKIKLAKPARVGSNKTIVGLGNDALVTGAGFMLKGSHNVILKNLSIHDVEGDAIDVEAASQHVWIDHCDLARASDGLVDIKTASDYVTVSWCHFHDHHKTCLLGHSDKEKNLEVDRGKLRVTYHHNFFDGTKSRHPRVRVAEGVHVFNNYFRANEYGVAATMDAAVLVEGNYFEQVAQPTLTSYESSKTLGRLVERQNVFENSGAPKTNGMVEELSKHYAYRLDPASSIPDLLRRGAGVSR